ncbi:hypothetical protein BO83DRAFT_403877 [Aspergillus eucalypticola CBS 122712]|uniref:Uncharacterized protein n=1 Tax=Aspergillus eucalypticola (strain CBS 122712 / IBT 29274) TaxID=1448314 RepID=A0A317UMN8_ASPEC|nr:uncharacterized protein BO83DRAFT_403877 [Aspergillus eucalypticola CBS 122712]PWY62426.1 hypothetical protein BO83DRAFT_403877 [Aspergillus eucalypticola CBS 122712]
MLRGGEARRSVTALGSGNTEAKQLLRLNGQCCVVMLAGTGDPFTPSSWSQVGPASATINTRTMGCFFRRVACPTGPSGCYSTDIDSGLNTRLLKYSLIGSRSSFFPQPPPIHPHSLSPLDLTLYIPSAQGPRIICSFPSPLLRRLLLLPVRLRHRRGGSQPSER